MQTLQINSRSQAVEALANATKIAKKEKPHIRKTAERGVYLVESKSNPGQFHTVVCNSEKKTITCTCPARKPCMHLAAVADYHSFMVYEAQRLAIEAAPLCRGCAMLVASTGEGFCQYCGEIEDIHTAMVGS